MLLVSVDLSLFVFGSVHKTAGYEGQEEYSLQIGLSLQVVNKNYSISFEKS